VFCVPATVRLAYTRATAAMPCVHCEAFESLNPSSIGGAAFLACEMCDLVPRSESLTRTWWKGRGELNRLLPSFLHPLISSFNGPHTGLSHQGERIKTVGATIAAICNYLNELGALEGEVLSISLNE
jgi:hypothetical protein